MRVVRWCSDTKGFPPLNLENSLCGSRLMAFLQRNGLMITGYPSNVPHPIDLVARDQGQRESRGFGMYSPRRQECIARAITSGRMYMTDAVPDSSGKIQMIVSSIWPNDGSEGDGPRNITYMDRAVVRVLGTSVLRKNPGLSLTTPSLLEHKDACDNSLSNSRSLSLPPAPTRPGTCRSSSPANCIDPHRATPQDGALPPATENQGLPIHTPPLTLAVPKNALDAATMWAPTSQIRRRAPRSQSDIQFVNPVIRPEPRGGTISPTPRVRFDYESTSDDGRESRTPTTRIMEAAVVRRLKRSATADVGGPSTSPTSNTSAQNSVASTDEIQVTPPGRRPRRQNQANVKDLSGGGPINKKRKCSLDSPESRTGPGTSDAAGNERRPKGRTITKPSRVPLTIRDLEDRRGKKRLPSRGPAKKN